MSALPREIWKAVRFSGYARYFLLRRIKQLFHAKSGDDFHWDIYTHHYRGEIAEIGTAHTLLLKPGDYAFEENGLRQKNGAVKPLHPNWHLLYETLLQLSPGSVLEAGCGNGMHLHNLNVLAPGVSLFGVDRSAGQLDYLREFNPGLKAQIRQFDLTSQPPAPPVQAVDICYSQAVIMHIKEGDGHLQALSNMFSLAGKQVVLMENWQDHDFLADIRSLFAQKRITWERLFLYYRASENAPHPHIMICSSVPLRYPVLETYAPLLNSVKG